LAESREAQNRKSLKFNSIALVLLLHLVPGNFYFCCSAHTQVGRIWSVGRREKQERAKGAVMNKAQKYIAKHCIDLVVYHIKPSKTNIHTYVE
jgi:hypothetical protein